MNLSFHIARRYLFSGQFRNAIHLITLVSVLGVAAASTAMVCVLSAFNGFQDLLSTLYSHFDPEIKITATKGKSFSVDTPSFLALRHHENVSVFCECLEENCLARYKGSQTSAVVKGVSDGFAQLTCMEENAYVGQFLLTQDDIPYASIGTGVAATLSTGYSLVEPITLYAPRRNGTVNMANPASSFRTKRILLSSIFCIGQPEYDDRYIVTSIGFSRELFGFSPDEVTSVELKLKDSVRLLRTKEEIRRLLGKDFAVLDLQEQKSEFFHVTRMEKFVTFLMLSFILLIALFNVIGSLSMLILEKRNDAGILSVLGADVSTVRRVFLYEGWLIAGLGGVIGIVLGTLLCLAQQRFGFIRLGGGGFIVDAYPVVIRPTDLILTLIAVLATSMPSVWWPVHHAFKTSDGSTGHTHSNGLASVAGLLFLSAATCTPLQAQRSYGGSPLDESAYARLREKGLTRCLHPEGLLLPTVNTDSIREVDSLYRNFHGAQRFAFRIPVNINPDNSGETCHTEDGGRIWRTRICSKGAKSLNVVFDRFNIPPGAELFLFNPDHSEVLGAFTHLNVQSGGELPTAPVSGEELIIEYHEPPGAPFEGELQIYGVNHDYLGLRVGRRFNQLQLPCLDPLSCAEPYEEIGRSVCLLIIDGSEYCTGAFVNNTSNDGRPFILTAGHCFPNEDTHLGSRTLVFMNYESPRCLEEIQGSEEFSLANCTTRAISLKGDFALLELADLPPADFRPYMAGWNLNPDVRHNAPFVCIHHPYGEGKRYAVEEDSIAFADWTFGEGISPAMHWNVAQYEHGHTWSGSSGAPLFDADGKVVGLLSGGDSGGVAGCDSARNGDFFARMDKIWTLHPESHRQLQCWLDPDGRGVTSMDGYDPYAAQHVERLSNISRNDRPVPLFFPGFGYLFGSNSDYTTFAEEYRADSSLAVFGVYLMAHKGWNNPARTIRVQVRHGSKPDSILCEKVMNPFFLDYSLSGFQTSPKSIYADKENFIRFDSAVHVGNHFFISCDIGPSEAAATDTFALFGFHTPINTTWYEKDGWHPLPTHPLKPGVCSSWMEPVVRTANLPPSDDNPSDTITAFPQQVVLAYNPSTRTVSYTLPKDWYQSVTIEVYDVSGHFILRQNNHYGENSFPLPFFLPKGIYLFKIRDLSHSFLGRLIL